MCKLLQSAVSSCCKVLCASCSTAKQLLSKHVFYLGSSSDEAELAEREACSEEAGDPDEDVACRLGWLDEDAACRLRFLLSLPLSFPFLSPFSRLLFFSFFRFFSFFFWCFLSFFECLSLRECSRGAEGGSCCRCITAVAHTLPRSACPCVCVCVCVCV